ncbi:MAG: substrate-binding domain-containing protein [Acidobacteriaceae bacterium]|nr:substrate-binding domain-containing protein [Acidobacteriaceae bacterium]
MAIGLLRALREEGLSVPADLSVTCVATSKRRSSAILH